MFEDVEMQVMGQVLGPGGERMFGTGQSVGRSEVTVTPWMPLTPRWEEVPGHIMSQLPRLDEPGQPVAPAHEDLGSRLAREERVDEYLESHREKIETLISKAIGVIRRYAADKMRERFRGCLLGGCRRIRFVHNYRVRCGNCDNGAWMGCNGVVDKAVQTDRVSQDQSTQCPEADHSLTSTQVDQKDVMAFADAQVQPSRSRSPRASRSGQELIVLV